MLGKEEGYDAFLAQKIHRSREDIKAGRILTAEQAKIEARQAIEKKIIEFIDDKI